MPTAGSGHMVRMTQIVLPSRVRACLFDLDGVLTPTALVHAAAWKEMFDAFLHDREGDGFRPFDSTADYDTYVDGRPRADGVRTFLASRDIELPEGDDDDPPSALTVHGLGNRKNDLVLEKIRTDGVTAKDQGLRGKPKPDTYLAAAKQLGFDPGQAAVFEDALVGMDAGREGSFGYVVGVDRVGQAEALRRNGADVVVGDLSELIDQEK